MDDERYPAEYAFIVDLNSSTVRFAYPMLMAANYASIWILTLICAQRFQSICHPSNVWKQRLQFVRQSRLCIACSVLLALGEFWKFFDFIFIGIIFDLLFFRGNACMGFMSFLFDIVFCVFTIFYVFSDQYYSLLGASAPAHCVTDQRKRHCRNGRYGGRWSGGERRRR